VLLHELGYLYSDTDHGGGSHSFDQSDQGPNLPMNEGYATFFGCAVRQFAGVPDPGVYLDCSGGSGIGAGALQLRLDFETGFPFQSVIGGEADEVAIVCAQWDVIDSAANDDGGTLPAAPVPTRLAGCGALKWYGDSILLRAAAQSGETLFVLLGFAEGLTSIPGIVDLSIGNGYLYLLWTATLNVAGIAEVSVPLGLSIAGGLPAWLQGVVLGATPIFPLATTNVVQGKVF